MTRELVLEALPLLPKFFTESELLYAIHAARKNLPRPEVPGPEGEGIRNAIYGRLTELLPDLIDKYQLESFAVFGSVAEGTATQYSDLDVLVKSRIRTWDIYQLQYDLERALEREVDLVTTFYEPDERHLNLLRDIHGTPIDYLHGPRILAQ